MTASFVPPTVSELITRVRADLLLETGTSPVRRSLEYALARAVAGCSRGEYGYLAWIFRQCFPDTADDHYIWRWAGIFGLSQKEAAPWQGTATITCSGGLADLPAGTQFTRDDGQVYTLDLLTSGTDISRVAAITAATAGSAAGNDTNQELVFATPVANWDTSIYVVATDITGTDIETAQEGLARLLSRLATPPSGGGPGDYVNWALGVRGVTRAWEWAALAGPNTVSVAFVRDGDGSGADILPDSTERDAVYSELANRCPITVVPYVITLVEKTLNVTITGLTPDTAAVRVAIQLSLVDMLRREAAPNQTLALSRISAAISAADDEVSHVLTVPATAPTTALTEMFILGTVTYA